MRKKKIVFVDSRFVKVCHIPDDISYLIIFSTCPFLLIDKFCNGFTNFFHLFIFIWQLFQCVYSYFFSVIHHARPPLGPRETLLSPLVCIGPREAAGQLKKAVILSLPHCASLRHGHWRISLLQSEAECFHNDNDHLRPWSRTVTLGQETLNTPAYVQVRPLKLLLYRV